MRSSATPQALAQGVHHQQCRRLAAAHVAAAGPQNGTYAAQQQAARRMMMHNAQPGLSWQENANLDRPTSGNPVRRVPLLDLQRPISLHSAGWSTCLPLCASESLLPCVPACRNLLPPCQLARADTPYPHRCWTLSAGCSWRPAPSWLYFSPRCSAGGVWGSQPLLLLAYAFWTGCSGGPVVSPGL